MDKDLEMMIKNFHKRNLKKENTKDDKSFFPFLKTKDAADPLFPILSKRDKVTPLIPHLTEMAGAEPLLPDNLGMLNNIQSRSIPGYSTYKELTASRLFRNPTQMNPSIDFLSRLKRTRLL